VEHFEGDPDNTGAWLPFGSSNGLRLRPQECSIWTGLNFSGKSSLLGQAAIHWMRGNSTINEKVLLISPEMSPQQSLARMVRQMTAKIPAQVTEADVSACLAWLEGKFWIYTAVGQVSVSDLNNVIRYTAAELGVTQVIVDNLSVLELEGQDTNRAQGDLMTKFVHTSRTSGCHISLVAHNRKPAQGEKPSRYQISGSGALSNLADNVISIVRNERKDEQLANITLSEEDRRELTAQADTRLIVQKQRHGTAYTGTSKLFFSPYSMRWSEDRNSADLAIPEIQELADLGEPNSRGYGA
jgi:twinkle protein